MKIEIRDCDHARLVAVAKERGQSDVSQVVSDALGVYFDLQERSESGHRPETLKTSKWAKVASFHREHPSLKGNSDRVNEIIHEFRAEFAL